MLLSNIMPILYISIGIFLLMIKISANSPIFYFNEHMKGANTTDFDELRKGLYQNVLVDLVFIRFVSKVKVTFIPDEKGSTPRLYALHITSLKQLHSIASINFMDRSYTINIGNYVRFIQIFGTVNITDVQIDMGEIPRIEYYVGCFSRRKSINHDYINTLNGTFKVQQCQMGCKDFELYGINSSGNCICIKDVAGLINDKPKNCRQICEDTYGFCGGENLFSVYSKSYQLGNVSTSNPWNCIMKDNTYCQTCQSGYKGYDCNILDCSSSTSCGRLKTCKKAKFYNRTKLQFGICTCIDGYSIDNYFNCKDIDECEPERPCPSTFICNNTLGSYLCTCRLGYENRSGSCKDVDECSDVRFCDNITTRCHNTNGSYYCLCIGGFQNLNSTKLPASCEDVDECRDGKYCALNSTVCVNLRGFYYCHCKVGFQNYDSYKVPSSCEDIDECKNATSCGSTYICYNIIGSYLCTCRKGYDDRSGFCGDIDECYDGLLCDLESTICINEPGSYTCHCKYGYERFSSTLPAQCYDIDECLHNQHDCDKNSSYCFNKPGLFTCECHRGYKRLNRFTCEDINECTEFLHGCGKASECVNSLGSYECKCPPGSIANVFNYAVECQDINECDEVNACNESISVCLNMPFNYICQCFPGYINVNNFTCKRAPVTTPIDKTLTTAELHWFTETTTPSIFDESLDFFQDFGALIIIVAFIAAALAYLVIMLMRRNSSRSGTMSTLTTVD